MEDNIPADGNGRTVIRMAEAEKQEAEPTEKMKIKKMKKESVR